MSTSFVHVNFANKTWWYTNKKFVQLIAIKLVFFIRKGKLILEINDDRTGNKFVALFVEKRHAFVCDHGMPWLMNNWLTQIIQTFKIKANNVFHLVWLTSQAGTMVPSLECVNLGNKTHKKEICARHGNEFLSHINEELLIAITRCNK